MIVLPAKRSNKLNMTEVLKDIKGHKKTEPTIVDPAKPKRIEL